MRKSFNGLQGIINEELGRYLPSSEAFVFVGKNKKTAKILHREGNGLTLYIRRLNTGTYKLKKSTDGGENVFTMDYNDFVLLLLGQNAIEKTLQNVDE